MKRAAWLACLSVAALLGGCGPSTAPVQAPAEAAQVQRAPDTRRIHALIVGVDRYRFSDVRQPGAVFSDLRGAVGDALRFKQALNEIYGVTVDVPTGGACDSSNAATTTLIDDCATRDRILSALEQRISTLHSGDTLLFYFAGHGSRYKDDIARDQDTGYNGTIMPTDARNPDGSPGDIFDVELKALKDRATAAGLYFVSVFDSCNSATATRSGATGQARSAPALALATPPSPSRLPAMASVGEKGYWVHLAAAQDGEEAQETGGVGTRAGVFTTALLDTLRMPGMRDATFGDMIHEVRLRVAARGHAAQTPSAEGELTAAMGARSRTSVFYDVEQNDGQVSLQAGTAAGITSGSRFALYANQADAVARRAQVATASVGAVDGTTATLVFDETPKDALPTRLVAEQIAHFLPADTLAVTVDLPEGAARTATEAAVHATGFARVSDSGATHLVAAQDETDGVAMRADDGTLLDASLGHADDPEFADRLTESLRKVARVQQLLALRTSSTSSDADPFAVSTCIAAGKYRPTGCPALQSGEVRRINPKEPFTVSVANRGKRKAFVYVLAIDPHNAIYPILPKPNEYNKELSSNGLQRSIDFDLPGAYRFVTLTSARPLRADAFEQSGNGTRDLGACTSPLERLLCASAEGRRDAGVASVGDWSAQVSTVLITDKDTAP